MNSKSIKASMLTLFLGVFVTYFGLNMGGASFFEVFQNPPWSRDVRFVVCGIGAGLLASALGCLLSAWNLQRKGPMLASVLSGIIIGGLTGYGFAADFLQEYVPRTLSGTTGPIVVFVSFIVAASGLGVQLVLVKLWDR